MVVGASLSISGTDDPLGFSHTTGSRVYTVQNGVENKEHGVSSCFAGVNTFMREVRRITTLVQADRKDTATQLAALCIRAEQKSVPEVTTC